MNLPAQIAGLQNAGELPPRPLHLAIGMFDGVHLGHRAVIDAAVQSARAHGGISGVLTFSPHPSALFRPENPTRLIQTSEAKASMLARIGVEVVITQTFDHELAGMAAEQFLPWLRRALPRLAAIYVGENFRFGKGRRGDAALLVRAGREQGLQVFTAPRVSLNGEAVSSTRIRALLAEGDIAAANLLLGYSYAAEGVVTGGKRLGRTIGFPTLNVPWAPGLLPRFGVYGVRISGAGGTGPTRTAVANYGVRPTVERVELPRLEVHVLDDCPWSEGDAVRVEWLCFLRPEMKFASLDALRAQIAQDRDRAAAFFAR